MSFLLNYLLESKSETTAEEERDAQIAQIRTRRRQNRNITAKLELDCPKNEFNNLAYEKFHELIVSNSCSASCYQIILNTLTTYFASFNSNQNQEESKATEQNIFQFLRDFYLTRLKKSFTETTPSWSAVEENEIAIRQREVYCLFRFYVLKSEFCPVARLDLSDALKFVYFRGGPDRLKAFMDEVVCDEFFLDFPFYIVATYQEMGLMHPEDLDKYAPFEFTAIGDLLERDSVSCRLSEFYESVNAGAEDTPRHQSTIKPQTSNPGTSSQTPTTKKKTTLIPETPSKAKMEKNAESVERITIQQTPIALMKGGATRLSIELNALLAQTDKLSENNNARSISTVRTVDSRKRGHHEDSASQMTNKRPRTATTPRSRQNLSLAFNVA